MSLAINKKLPAPPRPPRPDELPRGCDDCKPYRQLEKENRGLRDVIEDLREQLRGYQVLASASTERIRELQAEAKALEEQIEARDKLVAGVANVISIAFGDYLSKTTPDDGNTIIDVFSIYGRL